MKQVDVCVQGSNQSHAQTFDVNGDFWSGNDLITAQEIALGGQWLHNLIQLKQSRICLKMHQTHVLHYNKITR